MSKHLTLCMIAPEFAPIWGGVGAYTLNVIQNLPTSVEIHVLAPQRILPLSATPRETEFPPIMFRDNITVHFVSKANDTFLYNVAFQWACLKKLPELANQYQFDIIHTHSHMPDLLLRLVQEVNTPTVCTVHNLIPWMIQAINDSGISFLDLDRSEKGLKLLSPLLKIAQAHYLKKMDTIIAPSQHCKAAMIEFFRLNPHRIHVIYNGVETHTFTPQRGVAPITPRVLFVGRPVAQKGIHKLIQAIRLVIQRLPTIQFVFAGGGDFAPYYREFTRMNISPHYVHYLGHVPHSKMPQIYVDSTVLVLPSPHENCPLSIIEAMSCGKPVIASEVGGNPELITSGNNGLLYPYGDSRALADAIISILHDSALQKRLGAEARQKVLKQFSVRDMVSSVLQTYNLTLKHATN